MARITNIFRLTGYSPSISRILAQLCTYKGMLPQGAPSSPKLANLCCYRMDRRLAAFAGSQGFVYTRYADDMTFSSFSPNRLAKSLPMVARIVESSGFKLNSSKTRLAGPSACLRVTGLVVTHETAGIGRCRLRELRARIHKAHAAASIADLAVIDGWLSHIADVDPPRHQILLRYIQRLANLNNSQLIQLFVLRRGRQI